MNKKPKILSIKNIASTRHFNIQQMKLKFSNGCNRTYERLKGSNEGAVLVVPMLDDDTVLMIYEYSGGTDKYELVCPKGKIDSGESIIECANRELKEEISYGAKNIKLLKTMTLAPGYQSNFTHILLARNLYSEQLLGDEPEPLEVVKRKLSKLDEWVYDDDISEGRSIAALYLVREYLKKNTALN